MKKCGRCGGTVRGARTAGGPNDPGVNSSQQNAIDQSNQLRADGYARGGPSNIMRSTCPPESAALRYLWGQMRSQKFPAGAVVAGMDPNNPSFVPDPPSDGDQFVPPDLVMQHNQGCGSMPLDDIKEYFRSGKDSCGGPHGRDYGAAYTLPDVYMQDNQGPGYMPPDDIRDYYKTGYQICKCDAPVVAEADIAAQVGSWMGGYGARTAHIHARAGKTYHHPKAYEVLFAIGAPHAAAQHERGEGYGHWPVKAVKEHIEEEESKLFPLLLHVADTLPVIESLELRHNVMKLINEHTEVKAKYLSHGNEIPPELAIPHGKLEDELISQYADRILVIFHAIKGARVSGARVGIDVSGKVDISAELSVIDSLPSLPSIPGIDEIKSKIEEAISNGNTSGLSGIQKLISAASLVASIAGESDTASTLNGVKDAISGIISKVDEAAKPEYVPYVAPDHLDIDITSELEVIDTMPIIPDVPGKVYVPNASGIRYIAVNSLDYGGNTNALHTISDNLEIDKKALDESGLYVVASNVQSVKNAVDGIIIKIDSFKGGSKFKLPDDSPIFLAAKQDKSIKRLSIGPSAISSEMFRPARQIDFSRLAPKLTTKSDKTSTPEPEKSKAEKSGSILWIGGAALLGLAIWKFA